MVIACTAKHLGVDDLHYFVRPFSTSCYTGAFACGAPCIRSPLTRIRGPMEADRDSGVHGVNDVFANERLVLEPMRAATDLVHGVGHDAF